MEGRKQVMTWKKPSNIYLAWGIGNRDKGMKNYVLYTFAYSNSSQTLGYTRII